jgi:hypothetical protein
MNTITKNNEHTLNIGKFILGFIFFVSATAKLSNPASFEGDLNNILTIFGGFNHELSREIPIVEIICVILLIFKKTEGGALQTMTILTTGFIITHLKILAESNWGQEIAKNCGCFGDMITESAWGGLIKAILLFGLSLTCWIKTLENRRSLQENHK